MFFMKYKKSNFLYIKCFDKMYVCNPTVSVTWGSQFDELRVTTDCRFVGDVLRLKVTAHNVTTGTMKTLRIAVECLCRECM
jgi:hypothetical protein